MTIWDLGVAMWRRWFVVVIGLGCTAAAVLLGGQHDGVYWSSTQVIFLAPASTLYPNSLKTVSDDIIVTAGIVAKRVNGTTSMPKMASPEVTLFGRGISNGYSVLLPDTGGQWAPNFAQQMLEVQVVGPDAEDVSQRRQVLVGRISQELSALQDDAGVAEVNRITVTLVPGGADVHYVAGRHVPAAIMTALLGVSMVVGLVGVLEVASRRRLQVNQLADYSASDDRGHRQPASGHDAQLEPSVPGSSPALVRTEVPV
jgi:hypothetical protein